MFARVLVPARRTTNVEAAVLSFYEVSVCIELPKNARGKTLNIIYNRAVRQESALKTQLTLDGVIRIAGLFSN